MYTQKLLVNALALSATFGYRVNADFKLNQVKYVDSKDILGNVLFTCTYSKGSYVVILIHRAFKIYN